MTDVSNFTQAQLQQMGLEALAKSLGPVGMLRFIQQFEKGSGDYTRDRDKILGNSTLDEIIAEIKERRKEQAESSDALPKYTSMKMIDVSKLTQAKIRQMGIEALTKALEPAGMVRFMQQFEKGSGDYTRDRNQILGDITDEEIITSIEKRRQQHEQSEK